MAVPGDIGTLAGELEKPLADTRRTPPDAQRPGPKARPQVVAGGKSYLTPAPAEYVKEASWPVFMHTIAFVMSFGTAPSSPSLFRSSKVML